MNNSLDTTDTNHLKLKGKQLTFEILGGVNPENYNSLWVMLHTWHKREKRHRENIDLYNSDELEAYKRKVCEITSVHRDAVQIDFDMLMNELDEYLIDLRKKPEKTENETFQLLDEHRKEIVEILKKPKLLSAINEMIGNAGVIGNNTNRMILFLTYLTRKIRTGLHAVIQSKNNYLQSEMSELIPEEDKYFISHISDNALFYLNEEELQNKVLLVEDTVTNRKTLLPLIGFQKGNSITKTTVTKNEYAELVTVQKHVRGNVALSISTREEHAFTKNGLLSFVLSEERGSEQDERVLLYQRKQFAGKVSEYSERKIAEQIQNIQRVLSPITVINPFAMDMELPEQVRNKQITNLHYLRFIEIITFLKQYQRTPKVYEDTGEVYIESTLEDIKEANELLKEILVNRSDKIGRSSRTHLEKLKKYVAEFKPNNEPFTLLEIALALQVPKTTLKRYIKMWADTGLILAIYEKGQTHKFQIVNKGEYNELKAGITKSLKANIISIKRNLSDKTGNPKPKPNQNKNGAVKELTSTLFEKGNQKKLKVG